MRLPLRSQRSARLMLALVVCGMGVACAGPTLPDAPDPPLAAYTPTPSQTATPSGSLPQAPHTGGELAASGGGYIEFLSYPEQGQALYFLFVYNDQLIPVKAPVSAAAATMTIDGTTAAMTPAIYSQDGSLYFYVFPQLTGASHTIQVTATISGTSYSGSFTSP